ncbi:MAG: DUF6600 domain-containing protein, partial [Acidobacteriota bacterium]
MMTTDPISTRKRLATGRRAAATLKGLAFLFLMASPPAMAHHKAPLPVEPKELQAPEGEAYGRVRHLDGEVHLLRQSQIIESDVRPNTPLAPGDVIETGDHSQMEIQLADGTVVRLDGRTRVTFLALAGSLGEYENRTLISLDYGSLSLDVADLDPDQEILRVDTDAATLLVLSPGLFRLDAGAGGGTRVRSRAGVMELLAGDESTLIRSGESTFVAPGHPAEPPRLASTRGGDDFDIYVARRRLDYLEEARGVRQADRRYLEDLPRPIQPYFLELDHYGEWEDDPIYGTLWAPVVPSGWRPYRNGYWLERPIGWTWISSDPWGYAPYHYGRWEYLAPRGWCWLPGAVYAPAWVSWAYTDTAIGWTALGWYDYPSGWSLHLSFGSFHSPYWSFVAFHDFPHHHAERLVIHDRVVIHDVVYARRPPAIRAGDF